MYMICRQTNHDKELGSVSIAVDEEAVLASLDKRSPLQRCETWKGTLADAALSEADVVSSHARDTEEHLSSELHDMVAISETGLTQSSCSQICIHFAGSDERNEWESDMHLCDVCTSEFLDGEYTRMVACGHIFHSSCINPWLSKYHMRCSLCKSDLHKSLFRDPEVKALGGCQSAGCEPARQLNHPPTVLIKDTANHGMSNP